jgi:hypothetical protein
MLNLTIFGSKTALNQAGLFSSLPGCSVAAPAAAAVVSPTSAHCNANVGPLIDVWHVIVTGLRLLRIREPIGIGIGPDRYVQG